MTSSLPQTGKSIAITLQTPPTTPIANVLYPKNEEVENSISIDESSPFIENSKSRTSSIHVVPAKHIARALSTRRKWFANPKFALTCGMLEITLLIYVLVQFKVVEGEFFRFGPPIQLFQYKITGNTEFASILAVFFFHQLVFTWLNEVVSPWILNEIQDPSNRYLTFSKPQTLVLINVYYVYFTLNSVLVVNVSLSQLSFLCGMLLADFIATTSLNLYYVWHKKCPSIHCDDLSLEESGISSTTIEMKSIH